MSREMNWTEYFSEIGEEAIDPSWITRDARIRSIEAAGQSAGKRADACSRHAPLSVYGVEVNGNVILNSIRASDGEAKSAAIAALKCPGSKWKELEQRGWRVIRLRVVRFPCAR